MHRKDKLWFVVVAALASATTAHAQAPVDIGGTFQQIAQAADAWIPAITQEAAFLFYVLAALDFAWGAPQLLRESDFNWAIPESHQEAAGNLFFLRRPY